MNFVSLTMIFLFLFFGNSTIVIASTEYISVKQPNLEEKLACKKVGEEASICLDSVLRYSSPEAYIFKFKAKGDFNLSEIEEITISHARLMSTYINPLTAYFYKTKPALLSMLDVSDFHAENIIVEIEFDNGGDYYSAYFYPRLKNGNLSLIHEFFDGKVNIYKYLKDACKKISRVKEAEVYQEYCVFTNVIEKTTK